MSTMTHPASDTHRAAAASPNQKTFKIVYAVTKNEKSGKSFWTKIGTGNINRDGSMNLYLDAVPVNGQLQVRDWEPRDDRDRDAPRNGATRQETAEIPF